MSDELEKLRIYNPTLDNAQADAASQALERREEAERQAYLLLRELLPHVRDDGSDPHLAELLEESGVVQERETASRDFHNAVLGPRGDRNR